MRQEHVKNILALRTPELWQEWNRLRRELAGSGLDGKSPNVQLFRKIEAEIKRRKARMLVKTNGN